MLLGIETFNNDERLNPSGCTINRCAPNRRQMHGAKNRQMKGEIDYSTVMEDF